MTIYFCLSNLSERAPRTQSPRHGGKLSLQGWIANQPEMLRGSKQRLCSRSDPHRAMDLLGANVHPRKKILLTFSIHLSFSTGLWKEGHQRKVNKHTSMGVSPGQRDGGKRWCYRESSIWGLKFIHILPRQNTTNKSKQEASIPKPLTDKRQSLA